MGGGAVGVQLASDIKSFYLDKKVSLIHSREQLLPNFGKRLHEYVVDKLGTLGVEVMLGERPALPGQDNWESAELTFKDGRTELFDLVVCLLVRLYHSGINVNRSLVQDRHQTLLSSPDFLSPPYQLKRKGFL